MPTPDGPVSGLGRVRVDQMEVEPRRRVSQTATSDVFEIVDPDSSAHLALKSFADPALAAREEAALKHLAGGPVPKLLARGEVEDRPALIMEWVAGTSLAARAGEPVTPEILIAVARAIAEIHRRGVIHRDLKPEHVFLSEDGEATLIDFSAAERIGPGPSFGDGTATLTPETAAPEQRTAGVEGPATDIYGFGVLLHWLVTGRLPEAGRSDATTDDPLLVLAQECLAADPAARPPSAEALIARLETLEVPSTSPEVHDPYPETIRIRTRAPGEVPALPVVEATRPARRRGAGGWIWVALGALALAGTAAAGAVFLLPVYERHFKTDWVVDNAGAGDATTIADVLRRGGQVLRIELSEGAHVFAPIEGRVVQVSPLPSATTPPRIVASGGSCAEITGSQTTLSGLVFDGAAGGEGAPCLAVTGGRLSLENVEIEKAAGTALVLTGGAVVEARALNISESKGDGLKLSGGASLAAEELNIAQSGGVGLMAAEGAKATLITAVITQSGAAGLAIGSGADVTITGAKIEASVGSGVNVAQGARLDLREATVTGAAGAGLGAYEGALVALEDVALRQSAMSGLFIDDAARVTLKSVTVSDSSEHGVVLMELRDGAFDGVEITGNAGAGMAIFPKVKLEMTEIEVSGNKGGDILDAREKPAVPGTDAAAKDTKESE